MIELENDNVVFTFSSVRDGLVELVDGWLAQHGPQILAEDRSAVFETLLASAEYSHTDETWRASARKRVRQLTDAAITTSLRDHAMQRVGQPRVAIELQRTLRIPDDGRDHPLPPGLGRFPLRVVDDVAQRGQVPESWLARGGAMMPMYQAEAMWVRFSASHPVAIKIGAGGVNAVDGERWSRGLKKEPQSYVRVPGQPWLDGFCVGKGIIRQFVAMPLGKGYSAEEQIRGTTTGGIQLQVVPLRASAHFASSIEPSLPRSLVPILRALVPAPPPPAPPFDAMMPRACAAAPPAPGAMGLGAGGRMKQQIYRDETPIESYDVSETMGCFIHILNSQSWRAVTGEAPPQPPLSAQDYARYGFRWFDYYRDDAAAVEGSGILAKLKSVFTVAKERGEASPFSGDSTLPDLPVVHLGPADRPGSIRGWRGE